MCRMMRIVTILCKHSITPVLVDNSLYRVVRPWSINSLLRASERFNDLVTSHWNKNKLCKWGIILSLELSPLFMHILRSSTATVSSFISTCSSEKLSLRDICTDRQGWFLCIYPKLHAPLFQKFKQSKQIIIKRKNIDITC